MEHIILVTVENKFGVLSRIAGLFSGRGFNIESLSVAPTLDPSMSQMTIVTSGDERIADIFRANVIDSTPGTYTIEVTGDPKKIEAIINLLQPLGIKELTRTGRVAVAREPLRSTSTQPKKVARE